jgi:Phage capsid family
VDAENAGFTASDETFGQVTVGAHKGATKVIASEELAQDADADFEGYLSDEVGLRIATLEETAFATGDGTGKPLGVVTSVYQSADLPAAAANARSLVVGDFQLGYLVRRVRGVSVQRQEELHSDSGQIGFRAFERVDGRVILADALRILVYSGDVIVATLQRWRRARFTLERAVANARAGLCLFNATGEPCRRTWSRGLRDDDDADSVLVCDAHYGRMLKLRRSSQAETLRHALRREFAVSRLESGESLSDGLMVGKRAPGGSQPRSNAPVPPVLEAVAALSVAAGHLREAPARRGLRQPRLSRCLAIPITPLRLA